MDSTLNGAFVGLIVGAVLVVIGLVVAAMRKGASAMNQRPRRIQYFVAWGTPDVIMRAIIRFAQTSGYKIDAIDEPTGRIVLSDSANLVSWGFFYPVFLTYQNNGSTTVEVGIKSKIFQMGPIVTRYHEKMLNGLRGSIMAGM